MEETVDVQAVTIGVGTLVVAGLFVYGAVVGHTLWGMDTTTLAMWVFASMFVVISLLHVVAGRSDMALAHGGAAAGWILVLLESSAGLTTLGLVLLAVGGAYIVRTTLRERKQAAAA